MLDIRALVRSEIKRLRTPYLFRLEEAARYEQDGNASERQRAIHDACRSYEACYRSGGAQKTWDALARYQVQTFDIDGMATSALHASARRREQLKQQLNGLEPIAFAIRAAQASLQKPPSTAPIVVSLPAAISLVEAPGPGIREIYRIIFETLDATKAPYQITGRLLTHGEITSRPDQVYISYHTFSKEPAGLHFKASDQPHCFTFDPMGFAGWSQFASTPLSELNLDSYASVADAFVSAQREKIISGNVSKYAQSSDVAAPKPGYVFLALQTIDDAVQNLAAIPMLDMLSEVAQVCSHQGMRLIVKRHPRCRSERVERALKRGNSELSKASIHKLIAGSVAVCTVNSSVGAEALLHHKPVYLFGRADYQAVCHRITHRGQFAGLLERNEMPVSSENLSRFIYVYRNIFAVNLSRDGAREEVRRRVSEVIAPVLASCR